MPEICKFYGIRITMYHRDHLPPHFHAEHGEYECEWDIQKNRMLKGKMPKKEQRRLYQFCEQRKEELLLNWGLVCKQEEPNDILPI